MRGIEKRKHEHLMESLAELGKLLEEKAGLGSPELLDKTRQSGAELEALFSKYTHLLEELEVVVKAYMEKQSFARINLLSYHLKELKKQINKRTPGYQHFHLSVQQLYGTGG